MTAVQTLPRERLRERQWRRFRALAAEILAMPGGNPFFREKWRASGVRAADDLASPDDFARLPFTTKRELVDDQAAPPPSAPI